MSTSDVERISVWLAGSYSNRQQAMDQAVWFIPVSLWYLRLPYLFSDGIGFFTEQVNQHHPDQFYRSRVLCLRSEPLRFDNYKLRDQSHWAGASQDPEHLQHLRGEDLEGLPGCTIWLDLQPDRCFGKMTPGSGCRLTANSQTYVHIEFELTPTCFITLDRGFRIDTGEQVWGSRAGPYHYLKLESPT